MPPTPRTDEPAVPPAACLNCGQPFGAVRPRYCGACGQESTLRPPRLGEFIQQFGGAYFATEGALWRTLGLLLFWPGELTRRYLAGRRRYYVLPLRLYLTISLVSLLLVRVVAVDGLSVGLRIGAQDQRAMHVDLGTGSFGLENGVFYCRDLPGWLCQRLQRRIDVDARAMAVQAEQFKDRFLGNLGSAMFLLLPTFALWLKLAYLNRRMRYTEHLVFALHLHAFWFVAVALFATGLSAVELVAGLSMPVYAALAARRVYGGRWWATLLRGAAVAAAHGTTLALSLAIVGLWSFLA